MLTSLHEHLPVDQAESLISMISWRKSKDICMRHLPLKKKMKASLQKNWCWSSGFRTRGWSWRSIGGWWNGNSEGLIQSSPFRSKKEKKKSRIKLGFSSRQLLKKESLPETMWGSQIELLKKVTSKASTWQKARRCTDSFGVECRS